MNSINYTLHTDRLILSVIQETDAPLLFHNMSNPEISKDMSWKAHETLKDTNKFVADVLNGLSAGKSVTWCIRLKEEPANIIGIFSIISILRSHRELTYDRAELAYWIDPAFQGKGYMTEAGKAVLEFGFGQMNLHRIYVSHHSNNDNSKGLIVRLQFRYTWTEKESFMKNNKWIDVAHYELLKSEYKSNTH